MKTIDPNTTLADLVIENPSLTAPMEKHGLDYCCGGHMKFGDAIEKAGLDIALVISDFESANAEEVDIDWATLTISEMVDNILSIHHEYLHRELPRLCRLADKVSDAHGVKHPELIDVAKTVHLIHDDLEPHMRKEEMMLFPMVRMVAGAVTLPVLPFGTFANPIRMMSAEHEITGSLLEELRELTSNYELPHEACGSYEALFNGLLRLEADTHLHIHRENNILFPATLKKEQALLLES